MKILMAQAYTVVVVVVERGGGILTSLTYTGCAPLILQSLTMGR